MHVTQLLGPLARAEHVEVIVAFLPHAVAPGVLANPA